MAQLSLPGGLCKTKIWASGVERRATTLRTPLYRGRSKDGISLHFSISFPLIGSAQEFEARGEARGAMSRDGHTGPSQTEIDRMRV
jgi:hypothetical protein